jgi:hypothetical protein
MPLYDGTTDTRWHIWLGDKWFGAIQDEKVALAWIRKQREEYGRTGFKLNNRGPERITPTPLDTIPSTRKPTVKGPIPAWEGVKDTRPAAAPASKEERELKKSAKKRLDKHIADEKADLEAGVNR